MPCPGRLTVRMNAGSHDPISEENSTEWREHVAKLVGGAPEITWFDTPVIVDNAAPASKAA